MTTCKTPSCKAQGGFTLVELAIVMIIIGLLIGGILKGQQLISNAQIVSTVAQIKAIDTATTSFRDQYNVIPGDSTDPTHLIPGCANNANCGRAGDGDGRVDNAGAVIDFSANPATEQTTFWAQLSVAGLLSGYAPPAAAAAATAWNEYAPGTKLPGGGYDVGYYGGGTALAGLTSADSQPGGTYLAMHATPAAKVTAADVFIKPNTAQRIDIKIDDGAPNTGTVLAFGGSASNFTDCTSGTAAGSIYLQNVDAATCGLYIKFQN